MTMPVSWRTLVSARRSAIACRVAVRRSLQAAAGRLNSISLRTLVSTIGVTVALLVVLLTPTTFGLLGYNHEATFITFRAELNAARLARHIGSHERPWRHELVALANIIERKDSSSTRLKKRIFDAHDKLVLEVGEALTSPTLARSVAIVVAGITVGRVEVEGSLRPLFGRIGLATLVSLVVGFSVYLAACIFPLRALDRTLGELERKNRLLEKSEEELKAQNVQLDTATRNMYRGMAMLHTALDSMHHGLAMFDAEHRLIICNDRYAEMYGLTSAQVNPGTTIRQIMEYRYANGVFGEVDFESFIGDWLAEFGKASSRIQKLADGRTIYAVRRLLAEGGLVTTHEDISELQKLSEELEQKNKLLSERTSLLQAIIDNFPGGIAFLDRDMRVAMANDKAHELLGIPRSLFANGPPLLEDLFRFNASRGEYGPGDIEEQVAKRMASAKEHKAHTFERTRPDGAVLEVRGVPLDDGSFVSTYMDVTERHRSEAKILHMALHDALTDLPNRVLLKERLEQAFARTKRGEIVAMHLLDLDHFKEVNDTLGHPAGDKLLKMVTDRLRALVRGTDTIARMGGDEFAVLQVALAQPSDATMLAQRIIEVVSDSYEIDGHEVIVGTSIGIALGPEDGTSPDQLVRNADLALYRAKGDGRGTYCFFEPDMNAQMQARDAMQHDLRKALAKGELELHYQPVFNLERNVISSFEALMRWRHPERGMVPPDTFIALAEEIGLIVPLGEWALRTACATAARWPVDIRVSVNISPIQFRSPRLAEIVVGALAASGLPGERLELEVTEKVLFENSEATLATLYRLRELGVRIAMDDFGTGYSSLSYLQSFPFDKIKIDRSFVKDINDGMSSLNIVRAVTALAEGLGMETTAEGVETEAQLETIRSEGCTETQGFLLGVPLPADEVELLLAKTGEKGGDGSTRSDGKRKQTASAA